VAQLYVLPDLPFVFAQVFRNYEDLPFCLSLFVWCMLKIEVIISRMDPASSRDAKHKEVW
jgi:hypothetical protein